MSDCRKCCVSDFKNALCEKDFCEKYYCEGSAEDFEKLLPHWIPCSERLPEKGGSYLVSGKWASGKYAVGDCVFNVGDGYFETAWNFDVLAWMPLPKPWKGEKDDSR